MKNLKKIIVIALIIYAIIVMLIIAAIDKGL